MTTPNALILRQSDVRSLLLSLDKPDIAHLTHSLLTTLQAYSLTSTIQQPPRSSTTGANASINLFMPCTTPAGSSVKVVNVSPSAPATGTLTLLSPAGELDGVINAQELTSFRTALASQILLAARSAAGLRCRKAVIFGSGKIAAWTARLLRATLGTELEELRMVGRGTCEDVRAKMRSSLARDRGLAVAVGSADPAYDVRAELRGADAVFLCTPATAPHFGPDDLFADGARRPVYVSAIGSYRPDMREFEPALLKHPGIKIFVDSREACLEEAGEIIAAGIPEVHLTETGELTDDADVGGILVWKCVGLGCMDLTVGRELLELARRRNIGVEIPAFA